MGWFIAACIIAGIAVIVGLVSAAIKVPENDYDDIATAEAEANEIISKSITPELVELRKIEAYKEGTVFVVPDGSQPLVQAK